MDDINKMVEEASKIVINAIEQPEEPTSPDDGPGYYNEKMNEIGLKYEDDLEKLYRKDMEMTEDLNVLEYNLWNIDAPACTRGYVLDHEGVLLHWHLDDKCENSHISYCFITKAEAEKLQELPTTREIHDTQKQICENYRHKRMGSVLCEERYQNLARIFQFVPEFYESILISMLKGNIDL